MDDFYPASTFRAIFGTALRFYQAGQYDAALVSFNEVCLNLCDIAQATNLQPTQKLTRPCFVPIQQIPTSYMTHVQQSSRNLDRIIKLWKTQGPPFASRPNDGRVMHARRVYFSSATESTRQ